MSDEAIISECGRYRYYLSREFVGAGPTVAFIMLNPSTADAQQDDPTIRRCISYARDWGAGKLVVGNLFALRSTDPKGLKRAAHPVGPENNDWLLRIGQEAQDTGGQVVAAWGAHGSYMFRDAMARRLLRRASVPLHALAFTAKGDPRHPLYLSKTLPPVAWPYPS